MKKSITIFVASVLVIAIMVAITICGLNLGIVSIPKAQDGVRLGLDLKGGSVITFEAQTENGATPDRKDMETAQLVLRKRLNDQMYNEATVQLVGDNRIRVEIPEIRNPEDAVALLGKTAVLEFRDADGNPVGIRQVSCAAVHQGGRNGDPGGCAGVSACGGVVHALPRDNLAV